MYRREKLTRRHIIKTFTVSDFKDVLVFIENKEYTQAIDLLMEINTYMKTFLQVESAHILYYIAYCHDCLNNPYGAIDWVNRVLQIDPFNYHYASFRTSVLAEIENSIDQLIPYGILKFAEVEKIYQFLIIQGYVRSNLQFNMIRYYIKVNELETAKVMLKNYLERNPNDEEAIFILSSLTSFYVNNNSNQRPKLKTA